MPHLIPPHLLTNIKLIVRISDVVRYLRTAFCFSFSFVFGFDKVIWFLILTCGCMFYGWLIDGKWGGGGDLRGFRREREGWGGMGIEGVGRRDGAVLLVWGNKGRSSSGRRVKR